MIICLDGGIWRKVIFFNAIYLSGAHAHMHAIECKWRSENSTYLLIMGPRNQTHVIKVGGQYLYWMSHLTNRVIYIPF